MDRIQERAVEMALNGHNILITGFPGTGKTHTITAIAEKLISNGKRVQLTATTGMAAQVLQNKMKTMSSKARASTIHKFVGIKDGRYSNEEIVELIKNEESLHTVKNNLIETDVLIIDEISMLSLYIFNHIQYVLAGIRYSNSYPFGGIQIILSGDFYQLPPVANPGYGDEGAYCFKSKYIDCFHHIQLQTIHRQKEPDLIAAIHQISCGKITDETASLIKRLARNLPPGPKPVKLFAMNLDVEVFNSECLLSKEGELRVYDAVDSGDTTKLTSITAPKVLAVKKGCPVMLIVNLTQELVNGLIGEVSSATEKDLEAYFPSLDRHVSVTPYAFKVYDKNKKLDVAVRKQFPVRVAYALTVHKAQGQTLDRVSIDCKQMHQFGQLGVAVSRSTCKKGLQIKNFTLNLLRKPPQHILEFYAKEQPRARKDLGCCIHALIEENVESLDIETFEELFRPFEELEDSFSEDGEADAMANLVDIIEEEIEDSLEFELPETINISELLQEMKYQSCETDEQGQENIVISEMLISEHTQRLVRYLWNEFFSLKERYIKEGSIVENKTVSDFYREVHFVLLSDKLKKLCSVFGGDSVARQNVVFKISTIIRKLVLETVVSPIREKAFQAAEAEKGSHYVESDAGRGKIRYIGGWCFSQIRKKKIQKISSALYKPSKYKEVNTLKNELDILRQVIVSDSYLAEHSSDKPSLTEIKRRQNLRTGLTNISDEAFNFFLDLDKRIRELETTANLHVHGTNVDQFLRTQLENDKLLLNKWGKLFSDSDKDLCNSLLHEVLQKYCSMSISELRRAYLKEVRVKKTEAHRKQIKMRAEKKDSKESVFNYETIKNDSSTNKDISHKRLQSEILKNDKFLTNFLKKDLELICKAYDILFHINKTKLQISSLLNKTVLGCDIMPCPNAFNQEQIETSKVSQENEIQSTSSEQNRAGDDEHKQSEPEVNPKDVEYGTTSTEKVSQERTSKRKNVKKGKGKGKKKVKKSSKYPCGVCKLECIDNVAGCDGCDTWFHADCIHIEDLDTLPEEWFCNTCQNELAGSDP